MGPLEKLQICTLLTSWLFFYHVVQKLLDILDTVNIPPFVCFTSGEDSRVHESSHTEVGKCEKEDHSDVDGNER